MHAEHAEPFRIVRRKGAEAHQGRRDREARRGDEIAQQPRRLGAGIDDAAAGIEDRPLGGGHHRHRLFDLLRIALEARMIGLMLDVLRPEIFAAGELHVLRDVDDDGARAPVLGDVEGLVQDTRQILDRADEVIMLRAMPGDADRVAFLEGVRADQMRRHLAGDADHRDRIHQGIGQRGDRIGRAGAGGDEHDARPSRRAGIAFGRVAGALLMADENVAQLRLMIEHVVDRQDGAARIAEQGIDAMILQGFDHHFRAGHYACHLVLRVLSAGFRKFGQ